MFYTRRISVITKQEEFNAAMNLYDAKARYRYFEILVSLLNISLQVLLLTHSLSFSIGITGQIISLILAYVLTDFINGLVHMHMDNTESYTSIWGPFIAKFHLHHKRPRYQDKNIALVYFFESGSKIWLVIFLAASIGMSFIENINGVVVYILLYTGILSSVAEVSHYLCHNSHSRIAHFLAKIGLLLLKKNHVRHHAQDNIDYCFLNGMTNVLVNLIAKKFYLGYKKRSDLHYAQYVFKI